MSRFGFFQVSLGVVLMAGGPYLMGGERLYAWPIFLWAGLSVFCVGFGYLGLGARVFGKRAEDGSLSRLRVLLLGPYFFVAWSLWRLKSRLLSEPAFSEVAPGLYVGRRPRHAREVPPDAHAVIDLTSEFARSPLTRSIERYLCLPTLDTAAADLDQFRDFILRVEQEERPLFIHCAMGHGRSATVAAALMVRAGAAKDAEEACRLMQRERPTIHLHGAQRRVVDALARAE